MKNISFLFTIIVVFNYLINVTLADNNKYLIAIQRKKSDKPYDKASEKVQNAIDELVNDRLNDIYNIIKDNKESYGKSDEKIKEIESIEKRSLENKKFRFADKTHRGKSKSKRAENPDEIPLDSKLVNPLCPGTNYYIVTAYLSDEALEEVKKLDNVIMVEKDYETYDTTKVVENITSYDNDKLKEISHSSKKVKRDSNNQYYDWDVIYSDTKWESITAREPKKNSDNRYSHLSLISQGRYRRNEDGEYDNNYYYPGKGGQGVDVYMIATGFVNSDSYEFSTNEGKRTVSCDAMFIGDTTYNLKGTRQEQNCSVFDDTLPTTGNMLMSVIGGNDAGVAKNANLHMLASDYKVNDEIRALDYIFMNSRNPHKTVICITRSGIGNANDVLILEQKINFMVEAGFIIIAGAGGDFNNGGSYSCYPSTNNNFHFYAGFKNIISVGATVDTDDIDMNDAYRRAYYSNYGECIDIHAPGEVVYKNPKGGITLETGTGGSAAVAAGLAASFIEYYNADVFDTYSMKNAFIHFALKNELSNIPSNTPNRFLNNGKKVKFSPNPI
ncbi:subtilisin-like protein, partial [Anaeromyces robustus]